LNPGVVGVADGRNSELPPHIIPQHLARPIGDVERRVRKDIVGLQVGV
jgi:hypothetical protein